VRAEDENLERNFIDIFCRETFSEPNKTYR